MDKKLEVLRPELNLINNPRIRAFTELCLQDAPDVFWTAPASTSRRHHPRFANTKGGLVKHTKAAVAVALDLLRAFPNLNPYTDHILSALILHDTDKIDPVSKKTDYQNHTRNFITRARKRAGMIDQKDFDMIAECVVCHMGLWGLYQPEERIYPPMIVHLADYIASRKWMPRIDCKVFLR